MPRKSLGALWCSPALPYFVAFDRAGNARPRLLCSWCGRNIGDGPDAAVQVLPSVRVVCGRCISNLDDRAQVVGLADFFVAFVRNAGLGNLLRADVDDELIPVLFP